MQKIISGFHIDKICKNAYVECVGEYLYAIMHEYMMYVKLLYIFPFCWSKIWKTPGIHKREIKQSKIKLIIIV